MYPAALLRAFACTILLAGSPLGAATFVVTSNADTAGSTCGGVCTLRQAITAANATPAADTISFSVSVPIRGEILIQPTSSLPTITAPVTINGYSQSGTQSNTDADVSNAVLRVRLDGVNAGTGVGLAVCAADVVLRGLSITRFARGIAVGFTSANTDCAAGNTQLHGNFIGLPSPGATALGNTINVAARTLVVIGSASPADRNVIAGSGSGIVLTSVGASNSEVEGNLFGTSKSGSGDLGGSVGITISDVTSLIIGGASPNSIRHYNRGISIANSARNVSLAGIRIGSSDTLGIDLGGDGVTPNDTNDPDPGANDLQNFPVITAAQRVPTGVSVSGSLDVGHAGSLSYQLRTYASATCHPGGNGDGERFLGIQARSFSSTSESFSITQPTSDPLPAGTVITLTATRSGVGTSEFSACFALDPLPLVVNTTSDTADGVCNVAHCSLRDAIIESNNFNGTGFRSIHFAVPPLTGASEILIQPTSALPSVQRGVSIDGYTQPGSAPNTIADGASDAVIRIRIDGLNAGANSTAFNLCSGNTVVRGLSITRFTNALNACGGVGNSIVGNFIGLAADGSTAFANTRGINSGGVPLQVGSSAPADRNLISANGTGISLASTGVGASSVLGNLIGSDRSGALNRGNSVAMLLSGGATGNLIGSDAAPNRFRFNSGDIYLLPSAGINNLFGANSFRDSASLAIDLGQNGVTPNDVGDGDVGPNNLQNFPVLTLAERTDSGIRVVGSFDSPVVGLQSSVVSVYASDTCLLGHGELFLGSFGMLGNAFDFALVSDADLIQFNEITTTVSRADGTSEMGPCLTASDAPAGIAVDSSNDTLSTDGGCTASGDGNLCTLREAIALANAQPGADTIRFALPGDSVHLISPVALLPVITGATTIDGYTQLGAVPNAAPEASDAVLKVELRAIGLSHLLRICTTELVDLRGLAMHGGSAATIATQANDAGSCGAFGPLRIRGSWIGFRADGASVLGNLGVGGTNSALTFGGPALADRNAIGNNALAALRIFASGANGSTIANNIFGSEPDLLASASNGRGVELLNTSDNVVGGDGGLANRFQGGDVAVFVSGVGSDRNRVGGNRYLGQSGTTSIDLADGSLPDGINPNDVNDTDIGANDGQNSPQLTDGTADATSITINGTLDVPTGIASPVAYRLTFYRSLFCSDNGGIFGGRRGDTVLGSVEQPLGSNAENFSITLPVAPQAGFITATATSPTGSTSEIGNCLAAPRPDQLHADGFE